MCVLPKRVVGQIFCALTHQSHLQKNLSAIHELTGIMMNLRKSLRHMKMNTGRPVCDNVAVS